MSKNLDASICPTYCCSMTTEVIVGDSTQMLNVKSLNKTDSRNVRVRKI